MMDVIIHNNFVRSKATLLEVENRTKHTQQIILLQKFINHIIKYFSCQPK